MHSLLKINYSRMKRYFTKEVIIGIVTIISLSVLFFGINYLKGINIFKPTNHYYVRFKAIPELQKSSPVYVDGFKIGIVSDIVYDFDQPENITVQVSLNKSMKVQSGSYVELAFSLTAGASMHIILNKYVTTFCHVGDTIDGRQRSGPMEQVTQDILPRVNNLLPKIDSILAGLNQLVNHQALHSSLDYIEQTTHNLSQTSYQLNALMRQDIPPIMRNFKEVSNDIAIVSSNFKKLDFEKTLNQLNASLNDMEKVSLKLNSQDNNIGLLLNDRKLYDNLNQVTENASSLIIDLQAHPKKYVKLSLF